MIYEYIEWIIRIIVYIIGLWMLLGLLGLFPVNRIYWKDEPWWSKAIAFPFALILGGLIWYFLIQEETENG